MAPRLSDIQNGNVKTGYIPRTDQLFVKDDEAAKREYLFKFQILRKAYPREADSFPEVSHFTDLATIKRSYDDTLHRLTVVHSVIDYKKWLLFFFVLIEAGLGRFTDMSGFAYQQLVAMDSYDRLLLELGEKSYSPDGSSYPVEVRLLFLILMNTVFFVVGKLFANRVGLDLTSIFNGLSTMVGGGSGPSPRPSGVSGEA